MKFTILFALAAIAQFELAQADNLPFCKSDYYSPSICKKFKFTRGVDCNNNGGNPYDVDMHHPAKFSSNHAYQFAVAVGSIAQLDLSSKDAYPFHLPLQITNTFENSQPQNDYATCVPIGDGRGYTCGSGGYTSDDGSMMDPLQRYAELLKKHKRKNPFENFMAELNHIASDSGCSPFRGTIRGLQGLGPTWTHTACTDELFRHAQDLSAGSEIDYWAMRHAAYYKVKTNLGLAIMRDTMEQHGDGCAQSVTASRGLAC